MAISLRRSTRLRRKFLLDLFAEEARLTLVDIGANPINVPPYRALMEAGGCMVVGFEPQKDAFDALQARKAANETYINAAVGRPGKSRLNVYPASGFTSLFRLHSPSLEFLGRFQRLAGREETAVVTLRGIDEISQIPAIDVLKMDVQGAELDILTTGREKLAQAVAIIPEVRFYRLYEDEPLFGELDRELHAQGFVLHKFLPPARVMLGNSQGRRLNPNVIRSQLVDGDAVYIRNLERPEAWTAAQLRHLALAADSIFDSPDLALRCLDLLAARGAIPANSARKYVGLMPEEWKRETSAA